MPAFVVVVGIIYYCIIETGYLSTLDWNGTDPNPTSVGMSNYTAIMHDPVFWKAIWHTGLFFVVTFAVQTFLGFLFAALLHSRIKLAGLYKVIVFTPVVIAPATMAPVFRQMFAADGQLNSFLHHVGLGALAQPWLAQSGTALPVIMFITVWNFTGITFVLYYAAISQIEPEILEAARLDGASNVRTLVSIVWPGVRGTTVALGMQGGHRRTEDLRRALSGDRRRPQLQHRIPRHLHLPHQHPPGPRRIRSGAVDPAARPGAGRGARDRAPGAPREGSHPCLRPVVFPRRSSCSSWRRCW
jgi:raffinose/stachyose/melibiose transport system permease protein